MELEKFPLAVQLAFGATLAFGFLVLLLGGNNLLKRWKEAASPPADPKAGNALLMSALELTDGSSIAKVVVPELRRLYDVQSSTLIINTDIKDKLAELIDLYEKEAEETRITRRIREDRDRRGELRAGP